MANRTCSLPGCEKAHRARGLCTTHYNQAHQPDRHRPNTIICESCGSVHETSRYGSSFCSLACRDLARASTPSPVFFSTCEACGRMFCARVAGKINCSLECWHALDKATRPVVLRIEWRTPRECHGCGCTFTPEWTPTQLNCSRRCARRVGRRARRAREVGAYGTWVWSDFMRIAHRLGYACAYCGERDVKLEPDHVVPLSKGGPNTPANLLPACRACNCDKRDLLLDDWNADRERRGLRPRVTWDPRWIHLTSQPLAS